MPEDDGTVQSRPRRPRPEAEPIPLTILYEGDMVVAADKPAGMVVHPTYRNWTGTLLNGLLARYREPRIMTRLDRDTSGVVLVALGPAAHRWLQRESVAGRIRKEYLAVVEGTPVASGSILAPLARSPEDRRRVVVDPAGQPSRTDFEVLRSSGGMSLLRCELHTGRTHQIRVHLASLGHPVAGDVVYGVRRDGLTRQALHAWRVSFTPPVSGMVRVEAPLPLELAELLDRQNLRL